MLPVVLVMAFCAWAGGCRSLLVSPRAHGFRDDVARAVLVPFHPVFLIGGLGLLANVEPPKGTLPSLMIPFPLATAGTLAITGFLFALWLRRRTTRPLEGSQANPTEGKSPMLTYWQATIACVGVSSMLGTALLHGLRGALLGALAGVIVGCAVVGLQMAWFAVTRPDVSP